MELAEQIERHFEEIDRIAPPAPGSFWRLAILGSLLAAIAVTGTREINNANDPSGYPRSVRFTASDHIEVVLPSEALDGRAVTRVRSLHDAIDVASTELRQTEVGPAWVIALDVDCSLLPSDNVRIRVDLIDRSFDRSTLRIKLAAVHNAVGNDPPLPSPPITPTVDALTCAHP